MPHTNSRLSPLLIFTLAAVFSGCNLLITNEQSERLLGNWALQEVHVEGQIQPKSKGKYLIRFDEKEFGATFLCNGYGGKYKVFGRWIKYDDVVQTLVLCPDGGLYDIVEGTVLEAKSFSVEGDRLTFEKDGQVVVFVRLEP